MPLTNSQKNHLLAYLFNQFYTAFNFNQRTINSLIKKSLLVEVGNQEYELTEYGECVASFIEEG